MTDALTVVVADDHPLFRKGVCEVLRSDPAIEVIGEASDGEMAVSMIERLRPAIAVLDVEMPRRDGLSIAREVANRDGGPIVVLLTMHSEASMLQQALSLGVRGYVSKESAVDDILACMHVVSVGRTYVSASLGGSAVAGPPAAPAPLQSLTPAERRVLQRIARSLTTREIAADLGITPKTVEHHRANICQKLGVTGNYALVRFCLEHAGELTRL